MVEAILVMDKLKAVPPFDTQVPPGNRMLSAGNHPNDFAIFYLKIQIAPARAKTTCRQNPVHNKLSERLRVSIVQNPPVLLMSSFACNERTRASKSEYRISNFGFSCGE
jgi:hypothetical protein